MAATCFVCSLLFRPAPAGATALTWLASHPMSCCVVSGWQYTSRGPSLGALLLLLLGPSEGVERGGGGQRRLASASRRAALV